MSRRAAFASTPGASQSSARKDDAEGTGSSAKYIQGNISMVRSKKLIIPSLRNGVMVINIEDGGSLTFYKDWGLNKSRRGSSGSIAGNGSVASGLNGGNMKRVSSTSSLLELYDNTANQSITIDESTDVKQSIFLRQSKSRRNVMEVDEETKAKIEKVSVYVSSSEFREPMEMPYLKIPAAVPWVFKSVNKLKNEFFQITVPPLPNGELDTRVKLISFKDKVKQFMHVTTVVDGKVITFGTVMSRNELDEPVKVKDVDMSDRGGEDEYDEASMSMSMAESTISIKQTKRNTQIFTFKCPNARDLAVYAKTALTLNRMYTENRIKRTTTLFASTNKRVRTAEGLEIALQNAILDRNMDTKEMMSKQSTLGAKEYRCLPLYAYPYSWLTDKELLDEMVRPSKVWCDLREEDGNELGCLKMEVLQCSGIPKMDAYSLSDPMVYVVCGSAAFVTDVIPDKLDAYWLPLTRRACIMPVMNGYSQVYVGCFDYDGEKEMDDFIGRVVLDIPQLQAGYTYDVNLPMRDCSRVYHRSHLGFIRLRFRLEWKEGGERAALLSYLPSPGHMKKRMKNDLTAVTVKCPDPKSFYNIAHTVYGKDIPGKYSNSIRSATTKELAMINKMMVFSIKGTMKDISSWKHPLLSGYIFFWWMHFVIANSMALVPGFIMSLVVILLLRNYVKYYIKSSNALLYGHKTMGEMVRMLIFKTYVSKWRISGGTEWKHNDRPYIERLLLTICGMSTKTIDPQYKWRYEHHSEFPFSIGTSYPRITNLDENEDTPWNDDDEDIDEDFDNVDEQDEAHSIKMPNVTGAKKLIVDATSQMKSTVEDATSQINSTARAGRQTVFSGKDFMKQSTASAKSESSMLNARANRQTVFSGKDFMKRNSASYANSASSISTSILRPKRVAAVEGPTSSNKPADTQSSSATELHGFARQSSIDSTIASPSCRAPRRPSSSLKSSLRSSANKVILVSKISGGSKVSFDSGNELLRQNSSRSSIHATDEFPDNLPEQNVKAKKGAKKSKPIQDELSEVHEKAQKATFYLFDDRVFLVEGDKQDGERTLKLHESMNPVLKMVNPLLGGVFKIVDNNLNAFRALFNIFMWKDPALSFWATMFAIISMYVLFLFPWRWIFAAAGLFSVGPQNYFLADWFEERRKKRNEEQQKESEKASSSFRSKPVNLSASPLLMRNNTQMKPDGKTREIIVPSVPLRYNRFYDWPPDPSTTIIRK